MIKDLKVAFAQANQLAEANKGKRVVLTAKQLEFTYEPAPQPKGQPAAARISHKVNTGGFAWIPPADNLVEKDAEHLFVYGGGSAPVILRIVRVRGDQTGREDQPEITPYILRAYTVTGRLLCGMKLPHSCLPGHDGVILRQHQSPDGSACGLSMTLEGLAVH